MKVRWARTAAVSGLQETGQLQEENDESSSFYNLPHDLDPSWAWAEAWPLEGTETQTVQAMLAL